VCECLRQHGEVATLELVADVGQTRKRFGVHLYVLAQQLPEASCVFT
jgi:hypothetical protein